MVKGVHLQHGVDLSVLEASLDVAFLLAGEIGVFVHANERTAPEFEVLDHELSKAIIGVVHFVVKEEGKVEFFVDVVHEFVDTVCVDIAQHALAIEESWSCCIDLVLLQDLLKLFQIGQIAHCECVGISQLEEVLMLCMKAVVPVMAGWRWIFSKSLPSFLEWLILRIFFLTTLSRSSSTNLKGFLMCPSSIRLNQIVSRPLPKATICTFSPVLVRRYRVRSWFR